MRVTGTRRDKAELSIRAADASGEGWSVFFCGVIRIHKRSKNRCPALVAFLLLIVGLAYIIS